MDRKFGISFSWKRAVGISGAKGNIARQTGIPFTRQGRQRKMGAALGCCLPISILVMIMIIVISSVSALSVCATQISPKLFPNRFHKTRDGAIELRAN